MDFLTDNNSNPFSAEFTPQAIEANASNPTSNNSGGTNTSGYFNFNLTGTQNTNPQGQSLMATGQQPSFAPQQYSPQVGVQNQQQNNSNPSINGNALSLFSQTAQHTGVGKSVMGNITSSINDFGSANLGFANADSVAALDAGLSAGDAAALGSTANFVNAAGDSVAATALPWSSDAIAGTIGADGLVAPATADAGLAASSGSIFGAATLSGVLGAAGLGALGGGWLAGALGENSTGGSVGGAIGAGIGMMVGGPIGALIGGVGGAIFGGLFGNNSTPTNASGEGGNLTASGGLSGIATGGKNANPTSIGTVGTATQNFSSVAEAANTALGIQFNPDVRFQANYSSQHGGTNINIINDKTGERTAPITFNPKDPSATQQAYLQALTAAAQYSGASQDQLNNLQSWYTKSYIQGGNTASNQPPTLPNNPRGNSDQQSFQKFLADYQAKQSAGAAPVQTTVGTNNASK